MTVGPAAGVRSKAIHSPSGDHIVHSAPSFAGVTETRLPGDGVGDEDPPRAVRDDRGGKQSGVRRPDIETSRFGFTVPGGWITPEDDTSSYVLQPAGAPEGTGVYVFSDVLAHAQRKDCPVKPAPKVGTSATAIGAWIRSLPGLHVAAVDPHATVDGLTGWSIRPRAETRLDWDVRVGERRAAGRTLPRRSDDSTRRVRMGPERHGPAATLRARARSGPDTGRRHRGGRRGELR
jgi:hypothetical protein